MSGSTPNLNPYGNSPYPYGNSPYKKVDVRYPLRRKFALKGFAVGSFATRHGLKWRDLSNFLNGRLKRIGTKAKQQVREALVAEGLLKPRMSYPKIPCPACGRLMKAQAGSTTTRDTARMKKWLNSRPAHRRGESHRERHLSK